VLASVRSFRAGGRLKRDEIHDRDATLLSEDLAHGRAYEGVKVVNPFRS
jgi:hypothetical protein